MALVAQVSSGFLYYTEVKELEEDDTRLSFGTVYQNLKTDEPYSLTVPFVFFLRRVVLVIALQSDIFAVKFGGMVGCVLG